jgi:hypothetical protein
MIEGLKFIFWDLSGEKDYRGIWKNYASRADIIVLAVDGSAHTDQDLEDLNDVLQRFKDIGVSKFCVLFMKNDKGGFKILPAIDLIKKHKLLDNVYSVDEISYKDPNLANKIFRVIRFGSG